MAHPSRKQILEFLAAETASSYKALWTILDCARDEQIHPILEASYQERCCLYSGNISLELERAAPHLVQISADDRFLWKLLDRGWGSSWGILFRSEATMSSLRQHFRRLAVVRDEQGKRMVFRYYDPRVLRVFLPTCLSKELTTLFGPVKKFYTEGPSDDQLEVFSLVRGELSVESKFVGKPAATVQPKTAV